MSLLHDDQGVWRYMLISIHKTAHIWLLSTWLLQLLRSPFSEHLHKAHVSSFFPFKEIYSHTSNTSVTNFLVIFLLSLWPSSQTISHSLLIGINCTSGHFSIQGKWTTRHIVLSSAHLERFPFTFSQKGVVGLQLPTLWWCCMLCRALSLSSSINWSWELPVRTGASWEIKGHVAGVEIKYIWATSSCDILMLSDPIMYLPLPFDGMHIQLYDLVGQITPSSWWAIQVIW